MLQNADDQLFAAAVAEDVSFGPLNLGLDESETRQRVADALAAMHISHLAERATHMLSNGQKKRVAIAGLVAMRPEILLLDEPTAGLDHEGTEDLLAVLESSNAAAPPWCSAPMMWSWPIASLTKWHCSRVARYWLRGQSPPRCPMPI